MEEGDELVPSILGTKEHWDKTYAEELKNFHENGDPGEIWFSLSCQHRVVRWLTDNVPSKETSILDVGCGNGALLLELSEAGYQRLTGIDYSSDAVELAKQVSYRDRPSHNIQFQVGDILCLESLNKAYCDDVIKSTYDVIVDKGTYDAISLDPTGAASKRQQYLENISSLLVDDGLFLITSCNWTKLELIAHFEKLLSPKADIPAPTLQFGGTTGQTVTTIVFQKNS